jgi:uroporphyrin-III C-methyltransferase/precorrin-2 dehydrogenase/sirohydrochlorin ferrochelatase
MAAPGAIINLRLLNRRILLLGQHDTLAQKAALLGAASNSIVALDGLPDLAHGRPGDLVLIATGDLDRDAAAAAHAREAGALVNVPDRPELCDFFMPAIVRRGPVTVAIATDGASPTLASRLRQQIETLLPARLGTLAEFAETFRKSVRALYPTAYARRQFWNRFFDGPIPDLIHAGDDANAKRRMMAAIAPDAAERPEGVVYIVGAGPGDPDLLTVQALRYMERADIVLHDDLVAPEILARVRRDAKRVNVGKRLSAPGIGQDAINKLLVAEAKAGKRVLRLKGGDPFIFGRGGEEVDFARAHSVDVIVAPGITAALGCAAAAGIPLTHRDHASALTVLTGAGQAGIAGQDWQALARAGHTLAVYMGLAHADTITRSLIDAGLGESTPVAIVENGTRMTQVVTLGRLRELPVLAHRHGDGPALLIVGEVVRSATTWREQELKKAAG